MEQLLTFQNILLCSFFVLGMKKILSIDGVLGFLTVPVENAIAHAEFRGQTLSAGLLRYLSKPFYYCFPCMASFWGVVFFLLQLQMMWQAELICFLIIVCGVNVVIGTGLELIGSMSKLVKSKTT
jgi:hypothetical protein